MAAAVCAAAIADRVTAQATVPGAAASIRPGEFPTIPID